MPTSKEYQGVQDLLKPHVESFNYFVEAGGGLSTAVKFLHPVALDPNTDFSLPGIKIWIEDVQISYPVKNDSSIDSRLFPSECREGALSYQSPMEGTVVCQVDGMPPMRIVRRFGHVPIMVKSSRCHLQNFGAEQLVASKEEASEMGGYFILNGIERIIRMIIVPRRNFVTALIRPSFTNRGSEYTKYACQIRCVRPDQSGISMTLHYLNTGACNLRFTLRKNEFFIPAVLVLRALIDTTDREIYNKITMGDTSNTFRCERAELMIRASKFVGVHSKKDVLEYLGKTFRIVMKREASVSDEELGWSLLRDYFFVHIQATQETGFSEEEANRKKFDLLIYMIQKLYSLVAGEIQPDNPDALHCQEVLLPGHLCNMFIKEKLQDWLDGVKATIQKDVRTKPTKVELTQQAYLKKCMDYQPDVGRKLHYMLVTGNLISNTGLDLMQTSGFTIVADKLNYYRWLSHFRSVHRGQFFTTMKTTTVRKLLPESYGFLCPVHTPDGTPCGLLNHLAAKCQVLTHPSSLDYRAFVSLLSDLGLTTPSASIPVPADYLPVLLDGIVIGHVAPTLAERFAKQLRLLKVKNHPDLIPTLEIAVVRDNSDGLFPGIILASTPARFSRPVQFLPTRATHPNFDAKSNYQPLQEMVHPLEQIFLEIACTEEDYRTGETTHMDYAPTDMLSVVASLTPFSDHNQSPRNMYQCQMGKQTMGTPFHALPYRIDNKAYRIQTPQKPIVHNRGNDLWRIDDYPLGTNAIVAVISYTGYDMEDAMILNKGAYERGFAHASVYKYKKIDLEEKRQPGEPIRHHFAGPQKKERKRKNNFKSKKDPPASHIDKDGLPKIGSRLVPGDGLYSIMDDITHKTKVAPFKDTEPAAIEEVRVLGHRKQGELQQVGVKLRYNRNPIIGDKFSSRHGQKGVMSRLWPQIDMPFTESGMTPDIIINPHAFPSRMTIGMLIESMAGKAGACHGFYQDGTPFRFNENRKAVDYFGEQLVKAGYNYSGTEVLYDGMSGEMMKAEIFIGCVYYQRLRHMVSDKSQVRATGPVNQITRQPIKGRKVHGGIRFGEMERDSLLAHGTSFLLQDRLFNCSDYHVGQVCAGCGSMLSPMVVVNNPSLRQSRKLQCLNCKTDKHCSSIAVPYVFVYLVNELAAMNIKISLNVK